MDKPLERPNPTKCQSIPFTFPKSCKQPLLFSKTSLKINQQTIPKTNSVRYLGNTFSSTCTLHADLNITLKKTRNRANLLYIIKERDDTLALLAAANDRTHLEEDEDDREMAVSSSDSPGPESTQAEPSTSVEETVEPANGAPFKEVRCCNRHPEPQNQTSGPSREPPL
jgi:hypothetical protein